MEVKKSEVAVLALYWQVNIVKSEGAFGPFFARMANSIGIALRTTNVLKFCIANE